MEFFDKIKIYTIGNDNLANATENHIQQLHKFISYLNSNDRYRIIYRGDNYKEFYKRYNVSNKLDFIRCLFLVGDKGRKYREEHRTLISKKEKLYPINLIDKKLFEKIFSKLRKIFRNSDKSIVKEFIHNNPNFYNFFLDSSNKKEFMKIIDMLDNNQKLEVRDYFLTLLHQLGHIGFYHNSFFLSTTTELNVAYEFATHSTDDGIILISWTEWPISKLGITKQQIQNTSKLIEKLNLPKYTSTFYPSQNEFFLKGGLLPHYIIGYYDIHNQEFIINPHLIELDEDSEIYEYLAKEGFYINQDKFSDKMRKTLFKGYFTFFDKFDDYDL